MEDSKPILLLRPRSAPIPAAFCRQSEAFKIEHRPCALIVDDCHFVTRRVARALTARGFECVVAANGHQGLELAQSRRFELFVLDIDMPMINGFSLLKQLRQQPQHGATPVLMLSADETGKDRVRALALGASGYLTKPLQLRPLYESIDAIVSR
jgi:DNA-binding response OmpR family regulator